MGPFPGRTPDGHSADANARKLHLNEQAIRKIDAPGKGNRIVWDDEITGLGLRTTAAGAKAFVYRYVADGRERRMTIGPWPEWSTTAARVRAGDLRKEIDAGSDPLTAKEQRRKDPTFGELTQEYLTTEGAKLRRVADVRAMLERDVLPHWAALKVRDIRRRDVIELVERKAKTAPVAANRVLAWVRRVMNFAVSRDVIEHSPCAQVRKPGVERSKDRVLSRAELRAFWEALDGLHFTEQTAAALRLILATAQRPGEVCGMRWADLDGEGNGATWTISAEGAKNALAHRVPLNATARATLEKLPRTGEWIFPKLRGVGPIEHNTLGQAVRKALAEPKEGESPRPEGREPLPVGKFSPHDLRRTAASHMASAGIQRFIIGRVLNHAEPGVTKVYDRHGYDREKRRALDIWDRLLRSIVANESSLVLEFPLEAGNAKSV